MSIERIDKGNGVITLRVDADALVKDEAMLLKNTASEVIESGIYNIKLDLRRPKFIDSSGIGKLLFLNKKLENKHGTFEINEINTNLYNFLDSLAITKVMTIADPKY